jgi:hypothetical protein
MINRISEAPVHVQGQNLAVQELITYVTGRVELIKLLEKKSLFPTCLSLLKKDPNCFGTLFADGIGEQSSQSILY